MAKDFGDQMIIRKVVSEKPGAPKWSAKFTLNGQKYEAALWVWTTKDGDPVLDKNGNQQMKGKIKVDDYQPEKKPDQQF